MVQETIQAVKEAESKAEAMIKSASEKGKILVEEAKKQAEMRKNEWKKMEAEQVALNHTEIEAAGKQYMEEELKQAEKEITLLKEEAEKKSEQAIEQIIAALI